MNPSSLFGLLLITVFIVGAIIVGNFLLASVMGVSISELPPFLKFLSHLVGAFLLGLVVKKFFLH